MSDADLNDNECNDGSGACTLRAAIEQTNVINGKDSITLDVATYDIDNGTLSITDALTITGAGAEQTIIDANSTSQVFSVNLENFFNAVTFEGLQVKRGQAAIGGGIFVTQGIVSLRDSRVHDNRSLGGGGGIGMIGGVLFIKNTKIDGNSTILDGGGIGVLGGAVFIDSAEISGNQATFFTKTSFGGGVSSAAGVVFVYNSDISGNEADNGGGIGNRTQSWVVIQSSHLTGNTANYGGAIRNGVDATINLRGSHIIENMAETGGGGMWNEGTVSLVNTTFQDNQPDACGGSGMFNPACP